MTGTLTVSRPGIDDEVTAGPAIENESKDEPRRPEKEPSVAPSAGQIRWIGVKGLA